MTDPEDQRNAELQAQNDKLDAELRAVAERKRKQNDNLAAQVEAKRARLADAQREEAEVSRNLTSELSAVGPTAAVAGSSAQQQQLNTPPSSSSSAGQPTSSPMDILLKVTQPQEQPVILDQMLRSLEKMAQPHAEALVAARVQATLRESNEWVARNMPQANSAERARVLGLFLELYSRAEGESQMTEQSMEDRNFATYLPQAPPVSHPPSPHSLHSQYPQQQQQQYAPPPTPSNYLMQPIFQQPAAAHAHVLQYAQPVYQPAGWYQPQPQPQTPYHRAPQTPYSATVPAHTFHRFS